MAILKLTFKVARKLVRLQLRGWSHPSLSFGFKEIEVRRAELWGPQLRFYGLSLVQIVSEAGLDWPISGLLLLNFGCPG
jgi:hypothetical protein